MVFSYHSWEFSNAPQLHLWSGSVDFFAPISQFTSGVDIFIVLSGLCLFLPYVHRDRPWQVRAYATRRFWRIIPPYYAAIAFCTVLPFALVVVYRVVGHPAHSQALPSVFQYVTHLTFTQTFFPSTWSGIQGAFWTIGLEAQLYVVFPFLLMAYRRWGLPAIYAAIASSIIYRIALNPIVSHQPWPGGFLITITFLGRWMEFGTGMLLAWLIVHFYDHDDKAKLPKRVIGWVPGFFWVPLGLACMGLGFWEPVYNLTWIPTREIVFSIGTALLITGVCLTDSRTGAPWRWRPVVALGLISYSFYLVHQNLIYYFSQFMEKAVHLHDSYALLILSWTVGFGVVLLLALIFYRFIERPTTAIGRLRSVRSQPGQPVPSEPVQPADTLP